MELRITARHFDLTPELKAYAESTITALSRYFERIVDAHLVLEVEKHRKRAELTTNVYGQKLVSHAETDDLYVSIDEVVDKMQRQLKRYNARFKRHGRLSEEEKIALASRMAAEIDNEIQQAN